MRRSGKTTLAIDSAIQKLFAEGEIYVPLKSELEEYYKTAHNGKLDRKISKCIIDPDWMSGFAQNDLLRRLCDRLRMEHGGSIEIDGRTIRVV